MGFWEILKGAGSAAKTGYGFAKTIYQSLEETNMKGLNRYTMKYEEKPGFWREKWIFSESEQGAFEQVKSKGGKHIELKGVKYNKYNNK